LSQFQAPRIFVCALQLSCEANLECRCIPVTSRFPASAIPETTGEFDLGPPPRGDGNITMRTDPEWLHEWAEVRHVTHDQQSKSSHDACHMLTQLTTPLPRRLLPQSRGIQTRSRSIAP